MSLFSGPLVSPNGYGLEQFFAGDANDGLLRYLDRPNGDGRNGWLLLGDAVLADQDVLDRLIDFFSTGQVDYLSRTLAFTTPHHGSDRNFTPQTLERLGVPPIAIVPAGNKTYYEHPSDGVMKLLRENGVRVAHVHEQRKQGFLHKFAVG
jgi:hypothetical protein